MRVALATDWFRPRRGGIESQLWDLAERLGVRCDVDVITSTPNATNGGAFHLRQLHAARLPGVDVAVSPTLLPEMRRKLRGYDVVHAHISVISPVGYVALLAARSLGIPAVATFHSVLKLKAFALRWGSRIARFRHYPTWTAVSDLVAGQLARAIDADVSVLPNGIDLPFWRQAGRPEPDRDDVTLVSTMRLQRKKRPRQLLRAFARAVASSERRARLVIIGDGPSRGAIERDIRDLGLDGTGHRVELRGWLEASDIRGEYSRADAFVLASVNESFGIAALEACAAGLPVIAMRESGSTTFLQDRAGAALCADDAELTDAIRSRVQGTAPSASAVPTRLERFDWPVVIGSHEAIYERAMTRAAAAG
jgi:glycosyltransferase involved in cell wall biosynthesis